MIVFPSNTFWWRHLLPRRTATLSGCSGFTPAAAAFGA